MRVASRKVYRIGEYIVADRAPNFTLADQGITTKAAVHWNLTTAPLYEQALRNGEGVLAKEGAACRGHGTAYRAVGQGQIFCP